jgi:formaldehyde-activating enzyme involved in methanogenesis
MKSILRHILTLILSLVIVLFHFDNERLKNELKRQQNDWIIYYNYSAKKDSIIKALKKDNNFYRVKQKKYEKLF